MQRCGVCVCVWGGGGGGGPACVPGCASLLWRVNGQMRASGSCPRGGLELVITPPPSPRAQPPPAHPALAHPSCAAQEKKLPPIYRGKWASASKEEVDGMLARGVPHCYRFRVPKGEVVRIQDVIRGEVSWSTDTLGDFVLLRSNGLPVYNFCVAIDDALMRISHVIRAEEHLPNTLRQVLIYQALGFPTPTFGHVSLILAPDKSKLSKRHGATSVGEFREDGYLAAVRRRAGALCVCVCVCVCVRALVGVVHGMGGQDRAGGQHCAGGGCGVAAARQRGAGQLSWWRSRPGAGAVQRRPSCAARACLPSAAARLPAARPRAPQAMLNYLSLLGWNDGSEQEIYSVEELQQAFSLERITKSAAGGWVGG